jgi:hypothetical protein
MRAGRWVSEAALVVALVCGASCSGSGGGGDAGGAGLSNQDCAGPFFCERPAGMCAALVGTCQGVPLAADCIGGAPQCGCDGKTYQGDCDRRQNAVSKAHDGPCP